jgi:hypothetical protein
MSKVETSVPVKALVGEVNAAIGGSTHAVDLFMVEQLKVIANALNTFEVARVKAEKMVSDALAEWSRRKQ